MSKGSQPQPWWEVYEGDEECRFFKALARSDHDWRTTDGLAKAARLTTKRCEEIALKYHKQGLVRSHSTEAGKWQYWEKAVPKKPKDPLVKENQKQRIDAAKSAP